MREIENIQVNIRNGGVRLKVVADVIHDVSSLRSAFQNQNGIAPNSLGGLINDSDKAPSHLVP